jgi:predicted TPR repeat methyltransferase
MLRDAMIAHRAGRLSDAESGYIEVLRQRPADSRALHFLGLLYFHRGERERGIDHVSRSLEHEPTNARAWNALGGMFITSDRHAEAKGAYSEATKVAPGVAEGWYNLAICERDDGDLDGSIAHLRAAVAREPEYFRAYEALAMLLYQLGRVAEAARVYSDWAARDPSNAKARHLAAAMAGANQDHTRPHVPTRAADEYVRQLFDEAAAGFDANLERLAYRAPQAIVTALIERAQHMPLASVLDAGCGTGLCGPLIRAHCRRLIGVDLSPNMLAHARDRHCYDELIAAELTAFLRSRPEAFDAVISADTLVYFGALEEVFAAAYLSLHAGSYFLFTLEALAIDDDYHLEVHGRYAHSEAYVRRALATARFDIDALTRDSLRQERDRDVPGYVVIARKPLTAPGA